MNARSIEPPTDCELCPRLVDFRRANEISDPAWHNAPVRAFGDLNASLLIVGLAPGRAGANRTGRPFTGDFAGDLLYSTLVAHGFARGVYGRTADDGLELVDCRISNAVRCVPPKNRPTTKELKTCRAFLEREIAALGRLRAILALGTMAHLSTVTALGEKPAKYRFAHGAVHKLPSRVVLYDSYHCSRLNTNTGRLTSEMFAAVVAALRELLDANGSPVSGPRV